MSGHDIGPVAVRTFVNFITLFKKTILTFVQIIVNSRLNFYKVMAGVDMTSHFGWDKSVLEINNYLNILI